MHTDPSTWPTQRIDGFATLDTHRVARTGLPEVIYCAGKTPEQTTAIAEALLQQHSCALGTRATPQHARHLLRRHPQARYNSTARTLTLDRRSPAPNCPGILLIAAGTSDLPVAEEAAETLSFFGHAPQKLYDVGVSGIQRILSHTNDLNNANVIIVVAGMEGALPSVVGGLTGTPVIAVPTSVGYGANFQGLSALLGMLNSCAAGVCVMNIDNGFGAAHLAARINARIRGADAPVGQVHSANTATEHALSSAAQEKLTQ
ncbi:MAG: nickel pincer cofactor biosynthesis protein LarB [Phycisphaerae bacterium]